MRVVTIDRPDYEIVFGVRDPHDPEMDVNYHPPKSVRIRVSDILQPRSDELDLSVKGDVYGGLLDNPSMPLPHDPDNIAQMHATHKHADSSLWDDPGLHIEHLKVEDEYRGEGIGTFLFDVFRAAAVWMEQTASGKFGDDGRAVDFLLRQGVPRGDITETDGTWSGGDAVLFSTDARNLIEGDRNVQFEQV